MKSLRPLLAIAVFPLLLVGAFAFPQPASAGASGALPHASPSALTEGFIDFESSFDGQPYQSADAPPNGHQFETSSVTYNGTQANPSFVLGPTAADNNYYNVQMFSPGGTGFTPGVYTANSSQVLLTVDFEDSGCNMGGQEINVMDATYGSGGALVSFAATFEYHCNDFSQPPGPTPARFGDISYDSSAPFYGATLSSDVGDLATAGLAPTDEDFTIQNSGASTLDPSNFSIEGPDAAQFEIDSNTCTSPLSAGATCDFDVVYFPSSDRGTASATLVFSDELAPLGPANGPNGLGTGRHIALVGASFDGYLLADASGNVDAFGDAESDGQPSGHLNKPIVGLTSTPDGGGYWLVASDGGIFNYGDAAYFGSTGAIHLNKPIVGMASTPDGSGYWLVASDGGIFSYGDADYFGSTGAIHLNKPIVGMASTPDGGGYWLAASDGGIFSFGDATYFGSTGAIHLNKPIVGMASTPDGGGYWLAASDGGIFSFGDADYFGSSSSSGQQDVVAMSPLFPT